MSAEASVTMSGARRGRATVATRGRFAFPRFLCVGATCFGLNWLLMLVIDRDRYLLSSAVCFVVVGSFAYLCHARWTFGTVATRRGWITFLLAQAPTYPVALALLAILHDGLRLPLAIAVPIGAVAMLGINYSVAKGLIGRGPSGFASAPKATRSV